MKKVIRHIAIYMCVPMPDCGDILVIVMQCERLVRHDYHQ